ncbi:hypothetical protein GLU60_02545 [Nanohaloarchaea archaeon H01]|nr:hypothetical protein [Nanohaloarchaea archaeon H01]
MSLREKIAEVDELERKVSEQLDSIPYIPDRIGSLEIAETLGRNAASILPAEDENLEEFGYKTAIYGQIVSSYAPLAKQIETASKKASEEGIDGEDREVLKSGLEHLSKIEEYVEQVEDELEVYTELGPQVDEKYEEVLKGFRGIHNLRKQADSWLENIEHNLSEH